MPDAHEITATQDWDAQASITATENLDLGFRYKGSEELFYWVTGDAAAPLLPPGSALSGGLDGWATRGNTPIRLKQGETVWFAVREGATSFWVNARPT